MLNRSRQILQQTFGYADFRPLQGESIQKVLEKKDSLVIMPTGGGKSLIYQIPALLFDGLTIVISPLISLMKDQVEQLREHGVSALYLNSTLTPDEYRQNVSEVRAGRVRLLNLAPETLMMKATLEIRSELRVDCFTIDEAYCISEWGHDFRPDYRLLADVRKNYPEAVCLALTATATPNVHDDIHNILDKTDSAVFATSFHRDNVHFNLRS